MSLKISQSSQENICVKVSFLDNVADLRPATLLKQRLQHRCFAMNFAKILRAPFLQNISGQLFLTIHLCRDGTCKCNPSHRLFKDFYESKFFRSSYQMCSVKKGSQKFRKIYSKSTAPEVQPTTLFKMRLAQKFSCEFCGIFIFTEHLQATASGSLSFVPLSITNLSSKLK